ncbi:unnamed protein product [Dibothriocephalus latus]|uniref:Aromatic-L-amino-acid decarboxylase n=1 Tax=Dibothriocephalus latus TaxID=60516 RepID=A0A3P7P7F9_DIBLA|nr:unnamed protein product [Dibothriocephalus latus]
MLDWMAKLLKLPDFFLSHTDGGGVIQAHASVERAGLLSLLRLRSLPCNEKFELDGQTLQSAVKEDVANGFIPFYCAATLGTTATCSYDRLAELGPICQEYDMWLHVDAAYAGSALICPEFHHLMPGLEVR